jgi:hypothetical protein
VSVIRSEFHEYRRMMIEGKRIVERIEESMKIGLKGCIDG